MQKTGSATKGITKYNVEKVDYYNNKNAFIILNSDQNKNNNNMMMVVSSQHPYCCVDNIVLKLFLKQSKFGVLVC